jgi:5-methylcytosine-specific restriction enzyme subunit McrC
MLAYAVRYSINEIILFYPDTINFDNLNEGEIIIKDELAGGKEIRIRVYQLPVIARDIFEAEFNPDQELCVMFDGAKIRLVERVKEILLN